MDDETDDQVRPGFPLLSIYLLISVLAHFWLLYLQFIAWRGVYALQMLKYLSLPLLIPSYIIAAFTVLTYREHSWSGFRLFLSHILLLNLVFIFLLTVYLALFHTWKM